MNPPLRLGKLPHRRKHHGLGLIHEDQLQRVLPRRDQRQHQQQKLDRSLQNGFIVQ